LPAALAECCTQDTNEGWCEMMAPLPLKCLLSTTPPSGLSRDTTQMPAATPSGTAVVRLYLDMHTAGKCTGQSVATLYQLPRTTRTHTHLWNLTSRLAAQLGSAVKKGSLGSACRNDKQPSSTSSLKSSSAQAAASGRALAVTALEIIRSIDTSRHKQQTAAALACVGSLLM